MKLIAQYKYSVLAGLLLASTVSFGKDLKIAIVDFQQVVEKSPIAQKMNSEIESKFKSRQEGLVSKQSKLQEKINELKRNQSVMKEAQVEQAQNEITSAKRELEREGEDFQRELQAAQTKASKQFTDRVQAENAKIGDAEAFDIILQRQAASFINPKSTQVIDITDKLIRALSK